MIRMCGPAQWPRGPVASRERHGARPTRGDDDAPVAAHACAARRRPSAGRGRGGPVASRERHGACPTRGDGTGRWRHTHVLPGAGPPPAVAEGACRVARAARGVSDRNPNAISAGLARAK